MTHPYHANHPGQTPFYGRQVELARIVTAIQHHGYVKAAVMAGRGMGKTSFAQRLREDLQEHCSARVFAPGVSPRTPQEALTRLGRSWGGALDGTDLEGTFESLLEAHTGPSVVVLDEIEGLLTDPLGCVFLEQLGEVATVLGQLSIIVLGGSRLRQLLQSNTSPFLRTAEWLPLKGLSLDDTTRLMREPLALPEHEIPDALVATVHAWTAGHPWLVQRIMEVAVERRSQGSASSWGAALLQGQEHTLQEAHRRLFPIWWDNLQPRGQAMFQRLRGIGVPVPRQRWAHTFGDEPGEWAEVLETTGVAQVDETGALLPRCLGFRDWVELEHPEGGAGLSVDGGGDLEWEASVLRVVVRWAHTVLERAGFHVRAEGEGNGRLNPEAHFQANLDAALRQYDWRVELEAWSGLGRTDLKIVHPEDAARRVIGEVKIWGRKGYKEVVAQVLGYATLPGDACAFIVMLDRQARPLSLEYEQQVLGLDSRHRLITRAGGAGAQPVFITEHDRADSSPLHVHHILIQLPA